MSIVAKAKENPAAKMEKLENVLRSRTTNIQTAFKLRFEAIEGLPAVVNVFVSTLA